jgi:hypothetical protein
MHGLGRVLLLAIAVCLVGAGPASAGRLSFAAGEEMVGSSGLAGYGKLDAGAYWNFPRDLSVYTPEVWRLLGRHRVPLTFNLRYQRDFGPVPEGRPRRDEALPWLRTAARHRIPVTAWVTVPYSDGYWANEDNADVVRTALEHFDRWARRNRLQFEAVSIDLEASTQDTEAIFSFGSDPAAALQALAANAGPRKQCRAAQQYRDITRWLRSRGYGVHASAYPYVIDDARDGLAAFSDYFDLPLPGRDQYDDIGFMTMRTVYVQSNNGTDPGTSLQLVYGDEIRELYGEAGGIALGEAGTGPYQQLSEMVTDIRAAVTAVRGGVGLYSLEKSLKAYGVAGVKQLIAAGEQPLDDDERAQLGRPTPGLLQARATIAAIDAMATATTPAAGLVNEGRPALPNRFWGPCRALDGG